MTNFLTRSIVILVVLCGALSYAQQRVQSEHFEVVYSNLTLNDYAQEVANYAEHAWQVVADLFDYEVDNITIRLEANSDIYNGYATVYPHKVITLRALFPLDTLDDPATRSQLYHVILHEMVHIFQLSYTLKPSDVATQSERPVARESGLFSPTVAALPPAWFVEGIAVWVESTYTQSAKENSSAGRNNDLMMQNLVRALVTQGDAPSLAEASLATYQRYPSGHTRYLLGGQFVGYLIDNYGFEAVLRLLQHYNDVNLFAKPFSDFSAAWHAANGTSLTQEWQQWLASFDSAVTDASVSTQDNSNDNLEDKSKHVLGTASTVAGSPVPSPDGTRLAWVNPNQIMLAAIQADGTIGDAQTIIEHRAPQHIRWQDNQHLLYTRTVITAYNRFSELLRLNVDTGQETQLSNGARVHFPVPLPNGCVLVVHDVAGTPTELWHWCSDTRKRAWQLPNNTHVLSMASSPEGRIVMSLWQNGQVDLASLEVIQDEVALHHLTRDTFIEAEPYWQDETTILFRSARDGRSFQVYRLQDVDVAPLLTARTTPIDSNPDIVLEKLTDTPFGVRYPSTDGTQLFYSALTGEGFQVVATSINGTNDGEDNSGESDDSENNNRDVVRTGLDSSPPPNTLLTTIKRYPTSTYNPLPSLAPYALLPTDLSLNPDNLLDFSLGATLHGQDANKHHIYRLSVGYAHQLRGYLGGLYGYAVYSYRGGFGVPAVSSEQPPLQFTLLAGLYPYSVHYLGSQDIVLGTAIGLNYYHPLDIQQQRWVLESSFSVDVLRYAQRTNWDWSAWDWGVRASVELGNEVTDTWGYPSDGMMVRVDYVDTPAYVNTATAQIQRSRGLWLSGRASYPLANWGLVGTAFAEAYTGYRPLVRFPVRNTSPFLNQLAVGYRYSLPLGWYYGDGLHALERLTLAPQLYGSLGSNVSGGAALTLAADATLLYNAPVSIQTTVGYAFSEGVWTRVKLRMPLP